MLRHWPSGYVYMLFLSQQSGFMGSSRQNWINRSSNHRTSDSYLEQWELSTLQKAVSLLFLFRCKFQGSNICRVPSIIFLYYSHLSPNPCWLSSLEVLQTLFTVILPLKRLSSSSLYYLQVFSPWTYFLNFEHLNFIAAISCLLLLLFDHTEVQRLESQ